MRKCHIIFVGLSCIALTIALSGCTVIFQKGRRVDVEKISKLKSELSDLERAKQELERRLRNEISDKEVKVEMSTEGDITTAEVTIVTTQDGESKTETQTFTGTEEEVQAQLDSLKGADVKLKKGGKKVIKEVIEEVEKTN